MRKKGLAMLLTLAMLLGMLPTTALAAGPEDPMESQPGETAEVETVTVDTSDADLPDNDELFAGYVQQLLYPEYGVSLFSNYGESSGVLSADQKAIYDGLKQKITEVAQQGGSTTFYPTIGSNDTSNFFTISWQTSTTDTTQLKNELQEQFGTILDCLMVDCPYELYWYNKTVGAGYSSVSPTASDGIASAKIGNFRFTVATAYQGSSELEVSASKVQAAKTAAENAQQIVQSHAGESDYEKLLSYKEEICNLTSYNQSASGYGDPWQLIYVFDGNPDTNVVCEGYSKAFQYLCDLSQFDDSNTVCYTVTGGIPEAHMWNIVTLNGQNYLVDVTNSDENTVGKDGGLFLAGTEGSVDTGYKFTFDERNSITYTYDQDAKNLYGNAILTLASENYEESGEPVQKIAGKVTIEGTPKIGAELTANTSGITVPASDGSFTYQWYRDSEPISEATGASYTPVSADVGKTIKVEVAADGYSGTLEASTAGVVAKADGPEAPAKPTATATGDTITVETVSGQEYACVEGTGAAPNEDTAWQTSGTFTNLKPSTQYSVYTRVKETDSVNASAVSEALVITTEAKAISAVSVEVTAPATGQGLTANATVKDHTSDIVGEVKWYKGTDVTGAAVAGNAEAGTIYTAQITLTLNGGADQSFADSVAVTVNNEGAGNVLSNGKTLVITKTFPVTAAKVVESIAITAQPAKKEYVEGDTFDTTGMVVTATYDDMSTAAVTGYTVQPQTMAADTTEVTITFEGKTAKVTGIKVLKKPAAGDFSITLPQDAVYDGQPKTAVVQVNASVAGMGDVTVYYEGTNGTSYAKSTTAPQDAGDYTVTFDVTKGDNYAAATGLSAGTFRIAKAEQAALTIDSTGPVTYGSTLQLTTSGGSGDGAVTYTVKNDTGSATISGDVLTPTKAGTVKVTATKAASGNYNAATSAEVTITIDKADATTAMTTVSSTVVAGRTGTLTLPALPDGASYGTPTTQDAEITALKLEGDKLTYTGGSDVKVGLGYAVTIDVAESTNYKAYTIAVKLVGSEKITPTLTANAISVTYTGSEVPASTITGTATDGDKTVSGTWNWSTDRNPPKNVADSGLYNVIFTPDDKAYVSGTTTVQVTISKATPIGAPKYTAISASGKTLADAGLTTEGGTFNVPGTVAWEQAETTEVTLNTYYKWIFTPADLANYNTLSGTIRLWRRSSSSSSTTNESSDSVSQPETSGGTSTVTTDINSFVFGTTASTTVSAATMDTAVERVLNAAEKNDTDPVVVLSVYTPSHADSVKVTLPVSSLQTLGKNVDAVLTITSGVAEVTLDSDAISAVASQARSTVTLSVAPVAASELNSRQKEAVGSAPVFDLSFKSGSTSISDFDGGRVSVTLPYTLKSGQTADGIVVWYMDNNGNLTACDTTYSTSRGEVTFTTAHFSKYVIGYEEPEQVWMNPYFDVSRGTWYYDAVQFVTDKGLMNGTTTTRFSPDETTTRAMIVTILHRLEGKPVVNYAMRFDDVAAGQWYTEAIRWAAAEGIVTGYGDGAFGPDDTITREQMAAILYRYTQYKGYSVSMTSSLSGYTDANRISNYATAAFRWICGRGIMEGTTTTTLGPAESATRAQVATILMRFCNEYNL